MDNSRLFLFAALVFVGMLLWQQWQADYGPRPVSGNEVEMAPVDGVDATQVPIEDLPDQADDLNPSANQAGSVSGDQSGTVVQAMRLIQVDTDVIRAMIDTRGGVIRSLKLKLYPTSLEQPDDWLELVHSNSDSVYIVQSGLRNKEDIAPTHHSVYSTGQTSYTLADGQDELVVPLRWNQDGIEVVKRYHFKRGDYLINLKHLVTNQSQEDWQGSEYRQIQRSRPLETSRLLYTYTGSVYYNEETKFEKFDFDDMEEGTVKLESLGGWIAMI